MSLLKAFKDFFNIGDNATLNMPILVSDNTVLRALPKFSSIAEDYQSNGSHYSLEYVYQGEDVWLSSAGDIVKTAELKAPVTVIRIGAKAKNV